MTNTPHSHHILEAFEQALRDCREQVITMGSITRQNLQSAFEGLMNRCNESCNQAIADDDEINQLDKKIDASAQELLLRFQPLARDFREVIAAARISNNLERISDQAYNIAKRARKMNKLPEFGEIQMVEPLFHTALAMLDDCLNCFTEPDTDLALSIIARDKELDKAHKKLVKHFTELMESESSLVRPLLQLIFAIRFLERIGDHCVNMAEDILFIITARDLRYGGSKELLKESEAHG